MRASGISLQAPTLDAPLEGGTLLVNDYFMLVRAPGGIRLRLPVDVSPWTLGMVDGAVHISLCEDREMHGFLNAFERA